MKRIFKIEIVCEDDEAFAEVDEALDEFRRHMENAEGNAEGISLTWDEKEVKLPVKGATKS